MRKVKDFFKNLVNFKKDGELNKPKTIVAALMLVVVIVLVVVLLHRVLAAHHQVLEIYQIEDILGYWALSICCWVRMCCLHVLLSVLSVLFLVC